MSVVSNDITAKLGGKAKQGQNRRTTPKKERLFECFIDRLIGLCKIKRWHFLICDGFCGCGENELAGCEGSPLIIDRLLNKHDIPIHKVSVVFIDKNKDAISALKPKLANSRYFHRYTFICCKFEDSLASWLSKNQHGFVLIDPNSPGQFPRDTLLEISKQAPMLDLILSYPSQILKRIRAVAKNDNGLNSERWAAWDNQYLHRFLDPLKTHWQTSEIIRGNHGWLVLFGSRIPLNDWKARGIFSIDSPRGQDILERASKSKNELKIEGGKFQADMFLGENK